MVVGLGVRAPGPLVSLALGVFAVSWAGVLFRLCKSPAAVVSFWRVAFASAILLPFVLRDRSPAAAAAGGAPSRLFRGKVLPTVLVAGALLALHFVTWFESLEHTSIASSTLLVTTQPIFAALLSAFLLQERPAPRTALAIGLAFGGVAFLLGGDFTRARHSLKGDLLSLLGAVLAAAYLVLGRGVRARWPLLRYFFAVSATAAAGVALVGLALHGSLAFPPRDAPWLLLLAVGPHVTGHGLLNRAVRHFPVYVVNLAGIGEAVLASIWGATFFGEPIGAHFLPAAALIFAGIAIALRGDRRAP
ncbi:MAG TPA: DMT family transporter [Planctomycetota bacterium]|nr:DMT family transporter [Planctomycetota bacterium]